jgi:hypothetical protein
MDGCVLNMPNGLRYLRAGVDSAWEQEKFETRKMLENRAESPASNTRFVSPLFVSSLFP